jgi:hypothetical protein
MIPIARCLLCLKSGSTKPWCPRPVPSHRFIISFKIFGIMKEEIIVSGRMNPKIDPVLHVWGWEIPIYLFLGGLVAGILFFAAFMYLRGKEDAYAAAVKKAPLFTPIFLGFRPFCLIPGLNT